MVGEFYRMTWNPRRNNPAEQQKEKPKGGPGKDRSSAFGLELRTMGFGREHQNQAGVTVGT